MSQSTKRERRQITISVVLIIVCAAVSLTAHLLISNIKFHKPVARVYLNGEVLYELPLSQDSVRVTKSTNSFTVQVHEGRVGMVDSDCPNQTCVNMGFINGGVPIICVPNWVEIRIAMGSDDLDGVTR